MPLKVNAREYTEKWKRNTQNAQQDYEAGVDRVQEAPGKRAAMAAQKMKQGVNEAIDSGRWANNVGRVTLEEWKRSAKEKGASRISSGVEGATQKVQEIAEINLRNIEEVKNQVDQMPSTTFQDRIQRMVRFATEMNNRKVNR